MKLIALALISVLMSSVVFAAQKDSPVKTDLNSKNAEDSYADNMQAGKLFFQVSEDGKLYNDYEILDFIANGNTNSIGLWRASLNTLQNPVNKASYFYPNVTNYGSDIGDITNVHISKHTVTFDINLFTDRVLHLEAKRSCEKCDKYTATVSGLIKNMHGTIVKVEWKQVQSITLPYPIGNF